LPLRWLLYSSQAACRFTSSRLAPRTNGASDKPLSAAEVAWATIEAFREAGSGIVEGFGGASDVMRLWQMMRGY